MGLLSYHRAFALPTWRALGYVESMDEQDLLSQSGATGSRKASVIAHVLVPVAVDIAYSYLIPAGFALQPGDFVTVPLGARHAQGVVWEIETGASASNLKSIIGKVDLPPLRQNLREFMDWVARWTLAPRGMVLRMAVRAPDHAAPEVVRLGVRLTGTQPQRLTPARQRVLSAAEGGLLFAKSALMEAANCSASVIDGLVDEGALDIQALPQEPLALPPDPDFMQMALEPAQNEAALRLRACVADQNFSVTLLEGVTGSGKTEVYFEAVAEAIKAKRQVLILMPEIALTGQFLDRFAQRFGVRPGEWHSGVSPRKRARLWSAIAQGEVQVVAGARSALFLPFAQLGLIVVDEEHESAYKQEDGVSYHARDMAVVRGRIEQACVILASATPSIETRVNAEQGRYHHLHLDARYGGRILPDLKAIDLRKDAAPRGQWISPSLVTAIRQTLQRGEQALLYLNRRGYAPLTLCRSCGHRFQCPQCTAWLVEHRFRRALVCHHCGHVEKRPDACPECAAVDSLIACGPGVERLADEVAALFPQARCLVLSSDMPGGMERLRQEFDEIAKGEVQIVIGTQLVAKGHNFPFMTLVGVIDADVGLASGDPRAAERTFQMLQQVTGRAGRGAASGRGLVQTFQPDHPVIRALISGDFERFYQEETEQRRRAGLPPFGRLAALIISGPDRQSAERHARALVRAAHAFPQSDRWHLPQPGQMPGPEDVMLLGPAEAPIAVVRKRHRFRILVKGPRQTDLQGFLRAVLETAPRPLAGVRVAVDIDPQSFL